MSWSTLSNLDSLSPRNSVLKAESQASNERAKYIILSIAAVVSAIFFVLSLCSVFGAIGTIGYITSATTSGSSLLAFIIASITTACLETAKHKIEPTYVPPKRPKTLDQHSMPTPKDEVEKTFWEMHFQNKELHALLEMTINSNDKDVSQKAIFIVDNYIRYCKESNSEFILQEYERRGIIDSLVDQLQKNRTIPKKISSDKFRLENGNILRIRSTLGDGSCGIHALLGDLQSGYYQTDPQKARKQLCNWLRDQHNLQKLPQAIDNVLYDYFLNFEMAPSTFKSAVRNTYDKYHRDYSKLTKEEQDKRKTAWVNDEKVFGAYLENLEKTHVYLLQDEMIAAAMCFDKKVILYQPGWYHDRDKLGMGILNEQGSTEVHIWYNGYNHYQRAEIASE
jgi:hypothetical protein